AIHFTHSARTERYADFVGTKLCTRRERHEWRDYNSRKASPSRNTRLENGCEQDERAVSGTICAAPALAIREMRRFRLWPSEITFGHLSRGRCGYISTVSTYHG